MKKFAVILGLLWAVAANATIFLTEPFNYPDGSEIKGQGSWTAQSGTNSGPIIVTNQTMRMVFANAEDVNVALPGGPFNGSGVVGALYTSMVLNFESLPGNTNTVNNNYFVHFWDSTTTGQAQTNGFRCRLFTFTNGAPDGKALLGLTSVGGTVTNSDFVINPTSIATNTPTTVVMKLDLNTGTSQMWINPNSETDPNVTAVGPGSLAPTVSMDRLCFRQVAASCPGAALISNLKVGSTFADVAGTNTPPTVSGLPSTRIDTPKNVPVIIPFTVTDDHNAANTITTTATSANVVYVPNANLVITNDPGDPSGSHRFLAITPGNNRESNSVIKVVAKNPGNASNVLNFTIFIGAPSISPIPSQLTVQGAPPSVVNFQVSDHEVAASTLSVTASSSNPTLVPQSGLALSSVDGTNRVLTITPAAGQAGVTTITLLCKDTTANNTVTNSFVYDVSPNLGIVFSDNFDAYADGEALSQSPISPWFQFSGTLYQLVVTNKMAIINEANSEDIRGPLSTLITANSGGVLYYGFKLTTVKLPSANGDYFAMLKDTTTSGFRARTFVTSGQAAPGYYRVGIANGASSPNVVFPQDLSLNSSYYVVVRYIVGSGSTTLWVNPVAETSSSVSATDGTTPLDIEDIALRESVPGEGIEYIDNVVVSTAFSDVAPALIVNPIANRTTAVSTSTGPIPFIVTDKAVSPDACTYTGTSDNQSVVANGSITFGGSGTNRTVTIVPVAGNQGFANITVNVSDSAGNANTTSFLLTVGSPATNGIVISQVYPGGGNAGATYNQKFVELFNQTANPVSLNNWSLQYAASTGTSWSAANFANIIVAPYSYYLVAIGAVGTNGGVALPINPDYTLATINPSQSAGKIALCNSQGPLSGASPLSTSTVRDFIGYGTGTTGYEGSAPVNWTTSNSYSMFRVSGGCVDSGDNSADFVAAAVSPRNSASAINVCSSPAPTMRAFVSGNSIVIAWPTSATGFNLETAAAVNQTTWNSVGGATVVGSENQVTVPVNGAAYYRLKK